MHPCRDVVRVRGEPADAGRVVSRDLPVGPQSRPVAARAYGALCRSACRRTRERNRLAARAARGSGDADARGPGAQRRYICSLAAILRLAAQWRGDAELLAATDALPQALASAWELDWSAALALLVPARNLFVIGRGLGLGIAQEAALKLKETCGLHAEAFSAAEVRHGPMALVGPDLPVLCFAQDDETLAGLAELVEEFRARGARVLIAAPTAAAGQQDALPIAQTGHAACTPIAAIQSFYRLVNALALERGRDPDVPPHLRKVTQTV